MKSVPFVLAALASAAFANTAPTVVIQSAAMRPGTTLMDVVYRVNDPDDATVKTRALAFVDGVRSFANVIRPITFVEGTAAKLGDALPSNTNHTLTWDVAADWNVDLGQVKFEVLAMDGRSLLPIDWITIPAAGGKPTLTISKDSPTDASVMNAFYWLYAGAVPELTLSGGVLSASSGEFSGIDLISNTATKLYSRPYLFSRMNLAPADQSEVNHAASAASAELMNTGNWHAMNRPYDGLSIIVGYGQRPISAGLSGVTAIAAGYSHSLALKSDGTVVGWGSYYNYNGSTNVPITTPAELSGVTAIAAGASHSLALKSDGAVVGWGSNNYGQTTIPAEMSGVIAIAAGSDHSLALKSDGTVVGWGKNDYDQTTIPTGLSGVTAIAAGGAYSLALKSDGTVVGWGANNYGQTTIPAGLSGVTAIAAGEAHSLALKSDGTVVSWGWNNYVQTTIPAELSGVTAIAAGVLHSLALKSDGTVVGWGSNQR
jgi:hypothetical protein